MSRGAAKFIVRIVGTVVGLYGAMMLCVGLLMAGTVFRQAGEHRVAGLAFGGIMLAVAVYALYVGWLAWFRLSPLAVRHVCGVLGFLVLMVPSHFMRPAMLQHDHDRDMWIPLAYFGSLLLVLFLYRLASERLSRLLFSADAPAAGTDVAAR